MDVGKDNICTQLCDRATKVCFRIGEIIDFKDELDSNPPTGLIEGGMTPAQHEHAKKLSSECSFLRDQVSVDLIGIQY